MRKDEFLAALCEKLSALPAEDAAHSAAYYAEIIDDRVEDGCNEEEAVAALGSVEEIAAQVLAETPFPKLVKAGIRRSRALRSWEIVLLVLGAPVWLPLLAAAFAVLLAVYAVLWSVVLAFYCADLALVLCALAGGVSFVVYAAMGNVPAGAMLLGSGLILAGIAVLAFFGCNYLCKGLLLFGRSALRRFKYSLIRKEAAL